MADEFTIHIFLRLLDVNLPLRGMKPSSPLTTSTTTTTTTTTITTTTTTTTTTKTTTTTTTTITITTTMTIWRGELDSSCPEQ